MPLGSAFSAARSLLVALVLALAAAGCGQGGGGGGGSGPSPAEERKAVEKAAIEYIEETTSDEDDAETASALDVSSVQVDGDSAEALAESSATENKYEVTLSRSMGAWQGTSLVTDRPEKEKPFGSKNPAKGPGQVVSSDSIEAQIQKKVLKPFKIKGRVSCPPRVAIRKGNNFECELVGGELKGGELEGVVRVTQKDDEGNLNYRVDFKSS